MDRCRMSGPVAVLLILPALLAGCAETEPYQREGMWRPARVNEVNIAAQVANPADLVRGRSDADGSVRTASGAVAKLWEGSAEKPPGGNGAGGLLSLISGGRGGKDGGR